MQSRSALIGRIATRIEGQLLALGAAALVSTTCVPNSNSWDLPLAPSRGKVARKKPTVATHGGGLDHVVVITLDGVRWQDVFGGAEPTRLGSSTTSDIRPQDPATLMPELHRVAQTRGLLLGNDESKVRVSSPSTVSLPGYSELFGGRTPDCGNNECPATNRETVLDEWHRLYPDSRMVLVSSWPRILRAAAKHGGHLIVSMGRSEHRNLDPWISDPSFAELLREGNGGGPAPGTDDYRPDRFTAPIGVRLLELTRPDFFFLGLGDTDEHAHAGNYRAYLDSMKAADAAIGRVDRWLQARQSEGKRTLLIVTTDHGRAASFQHHGFSKDAARIWMLWSGSSVSARGYPSTTDLRLADVAPTLRALQGLQLDRSPTAGHDLLTWLGLPPYLPSLAPMESIAMAR